MNRGLKGITYSPCSSWPESDARIAPMNRGLKGSTPVSSSCRAPLDARIAPMNRGLKVNLVLSLDDPVGEMQGLPR